MHHETAFAARRKDVIYARLKREVETIFGKIGLHAIWHFEFTGFYLEKPMYIDIHVCVLPGMPFVIASERLSHIPFKLILHTIGNLPFERDSSTRQIESWRRLRQCRDNGRRVP